MEWNKETFKQLRFLAAFAILLYLGITACMTFVFIVNPSS